jgi:NADPH:quinone reductase-like Zn-dependent oxidoreductase
MRSYRLDAGIGLDGLRLDVSELPVPGPGEVLVEVRAASLGYREAMILEGRYVLPVRDGGIPLAEGVGVVSATGPDVAGPPVGARVVVAAFPRWQDGPFSLDVIDQIGGSLDGMLAEHVVLPATALVEIPDDPADPPPTSPTPRRPPCPSPASPRGTHSPAAAGYAAGTPC